MKVINYAALRDSLMRAIMLASDKDTAARVKDMTATMDEYTTLDYLIKRLAYFVALSYGG